MQPHTIHYEVLNNHNPDTETGRRWAVEVHAEPEELEAFARSGYLVRGGALRRRSPATASGRPRPPGGARGGEAGPGRGGEAEPGGSSRGT